MSEPAFDNGEEREPRRRFLKWAMAVVSLPMAAAFLGPMIQSYLSPLYAPIRRRFIKAAPLDALPEGQPEKVVYPYESENAFIHQIDSHDVWVTKKSATEATVFSPICTHLGCRYNWNSGAEQFVCPCHGTVFSKDGAVLAGPAPRPLDTLPYRIENGDLYVEWQRYAPGVSEKIPV